MCSAGERKGLNRIQTLHHEDSQLDRQAKGLSSLPPPWPLSPSHSQIGFSLPCRKKAYFIQSPGFRGPQDSSIFFSEMFISSAPTSIPWESWPHPNFLYYCPRLWNNLLSLHAKTILCILIIFIKKVTITKIVASLAWGLLSLWFMWALYTQHPGFLLSSLSPLLQCVPYHSYHELPAVPLDTLHRLPPWPAANHRSHLGFCFLSCEMKRFYNV